MHSQVWNWELMQLLLSKRHASTITSCGVKGQGDRSQRALV